LIKPNVLDHTDSMLSGVKSKPHTRVKLMQRLVLQALDSSRRCPVLGHMAWKWTNPNERAGSYGATGQYSRHGSECVDELVTCGSDQVADRQPAAHVGEDGYLSIPTML